jgi:predicted kinase
MRKWMSERLKRRKKPEAAPKEAAKTPEPLQPKFYDDEPAALEQPREKVPIVEARRADAEHVEGPEPGNEADPVVQHQDVSTTPRSRPARRRRGRGGRGRSRSGTASPTVSSATPDKVAAPIVGGEPSVEATPPQTVIAAPAIRVGKGTVVLAIGLPGSGKSSWFKRHNIHPLSSDLLRELLFDDAQEQRFQDLVFSNLRSMLKARLIARRPMNYVDATNLTPHDRASWIKLAKDYGYDVQGLFFDVPLEVCVERHQRRGRVVPEDIMRKMAAKLKAPTFDEGFSKITVVRVKKKEE